MPTYIAPVKQTLFILNDVLDIGGYSHIGGYDALDGETLQMIVETCGKFASEVVAPLNAPGDAQGCRRNEDGSVTTPTGYTDAYKQFHEAGWGTLSLPEEVGGQGLPALLNIILMEYLSSASQAFLMYAVGPTGVLEVLQHVGTDEQKQMFCPKLLTGEWSGTMALTEPHAGSDVGMIRSRAEPQTDGSYLVTGNKMFITNGEHDMTSNIIHLVLAKTPDAPDSNRGISMFVVPKFLVNEDGSLGERNAVSCGAVEHKMGLKASATCAMNYDGAKGWLVGEENRGLAGMFILMNAKRLEVGIQGLAAAEAAYQNGVAYALERQQGRALTGPAFPNAVADPIIVHSDVRRMLMDARAFIEPVRALSLWCGLLTDLSEKAETEDERKEAAGILAFLIPIIKGYVSEKAIQTTIDMQQLWGGHGYISENGMDQFVRDVRVTTMYEGTTGIQAMDMAKRKLSSGGGQVFASILSMIDDACKNAQDYEQLQPLSDAIAQAKSDYERSAKWMIESELSDRANGAFYFLELSGIVLSGLMWLKIASAAAKALATGTEDTDFYETKIILANYFADNVLPNAHSLRTKIEAGNKHLMSLTPAMFEPAN